MHRILFICGGYLPEPSANAVCVVRLQECLEDKEIATDVICESYTYTGMTQGKYGEIYGIVPQKHNSPNTMIAFWQKAFHAITYPINIKTIKKYEEAIQEMLLLHRYDLIICVLRPINGAVACAKICEDYIIYECDSITNNAANLYGVKKYLKHRVKQIETFLYKRAKAILHLKCHEEYYSKPEYSVFKAKSYIVDIPHLVKHSSVGRKRDISDIVVTYTGILLQARNEPDYALKLFAEAAKIDSRISLVFTTKGDCQEKLKVFSDNNPGVIYSKGFVSYDELCEIRNNTTAYLSLGLNYGGSVTSIQSKIFEYMSTGKPIIHIVGGKNDREKDYIEKYGNSIIIDKNNSFNENVGKLIDFLNKTHTLEIETVRDMFPMNTPEYTVNILENFLNNK